jgi:hypothetical protein
MTNKMTKPQDNSGVKDSHEKLTSTAECLSVYQNPKEGKENPNESGESDEL